MLQADLLHVLQVVQAVHVDPPTAVVVLGGQLALAILELQALEVVDHGLVTVFCRRGRQDVVLPAVLGRGLVQSAVEAAVELREDVGRVERLETSKLHPSATALLHLVQDEDMVGKAVLPRRHGLEEGREAALTLHVDQGLVLRLPV